jgi:hypothetical protein
LSYLTFLIASSIAILASVAQAEDGISAYDDERTGHKPIPPLWCPDFDNLAREDEAADEGKLFLSYLHPTAGTMRLFELKYRRAGEAITPIRVRAFSAPSFEAAVSNDWVPYLTLNLDPLPADARPEDLDLARYLRSLAEAVKRVGCDGTEADKTKFQAFLEANMASLR